MDPVNGSHNWDVTFIFLSFEAGLLPTRASRRVDNAPSILLVVLAVTIDLVFR